MESGKLNKNKYFSGFSLIEALVTVVIFSLTFIAFMSFSSYGVKSLKVLKKEQMQI